MRDRLLIALVLLLPLTAAPASAQESTHTDSATQAQRVELLEQEVRLLEQHTEEIQTTAHAATQGMWVLIGGSLLLLVGIIGVNFWQYNERYKNDKLALQRRLTEHVTTHLRDSTNQLEQEAKEIQRSHSKRHQDELKLLRDHLTAEIANVKYDRYNDKVIHHRNGYDLPTSALRDVANAINHARRCDYSEAKIRNQIEAAHSLVKPAEEEGKHLNSYDLNRLMQALKEIELLPKEVDALLEKLTRLKNR